MIAHVGLHKLELVGHLLAPVRLERRLGCNLWVLDKGKTGSCYLIFLVLHNICEFGLLSGIMLVIFSPLLDRGKPRFVALRELAVDVGSLRRLILLPFGLKS